MKLNVGCGRTLIHDWVNIDNSPTLRLAKVPYLARALFRAGLVKKPTLDFAATLRTANVKYGDVSKGLDYADESCNAIYSSHMLEHLNRQVARQFVRDAFRLLRPGGVLRLCIPDLGILVRHYESTGDADAFMEGMHVCNASSQKLVDKVKLVLLGPRHHQWMYDGASLCRVLANEGFTDVSILPPGRTYIDEPGELDLYERCEESVYVEGVKPFSLPAPRRASDKRPPAGTSARTAAVGDVQ